MVAVLVRRNARLAVDAHAVYADRCWEGWPGVLLDWPDFGIPKDDDQALSAIVELEHYAAPAGSDGGLLSLYRGAGLEVLHLPADDPAHDLTARAAFDAAVDELSNAVTQRLVRLRLPAALHCSAAIDRSPPVAARVAFLAQTGAL